MNIYPEMVHFTFKCYQQCPKCGKQIAITNVSAIAPGLLLVAYTCQECATSIEMRVETDSSKQLEMADRILEQRWEVCKVFHPKSRKYGPYNTYEVRRVDSEEVVVPTATIEEEASEIVNAHNKVINTLLQYTMQRDVPTSIENNDE